MGVLEWSCDWGTLHIKREVFDKVEQVYNHQFVLRFSNYFSRNMPVSGLPMKIDLTLKSNDFFFTRSNHVQLQPCSTINNLHSASKRQLDRCSFSEIWVTVFIQTTDITSAIWTWSSVVDLSGKSPGLGKLIMLAINIHSTPL